MPVLLGEASFFFRDFGIFSYPLAQYHRESFWSGEVPLWNPYNNLGIPFLAQWNTMTLYPLSLIYLLLPLPWSLSFFCLVHLWLAGIGMFYLARHWSNHSWGAGIAGFGFCFNGLVLSCLKWPNNMAGLAWMPWLILAVTFLLQGRKWAFPISATVGAIQMLSGAPEIILLTWIMAAAILLVEASQRSTIRIRLALQFSALALLVAGVAAAQLLPFLYLLKNSQRDQSFVAAAWPMPIWGWANFLVPLFRTFPSYHHVAAQPGQYWISTYYIGMPVLFAALFAIFKVKETRVRLMAVLGLVFLWLALGDAGGLYLVARKVMPLFSVMRFPIKFVVLPVFCLCLLSAYGIRWIEVQAMKRANPAGDRTANGMVSNRPGGTFVLRLGLLILLAIVAITCIAPIWPHEHEGWATTLDNGIARSLFCLTTLALYLRWMRRRAGRRITSFFVFASLTMLLFLDVRSHAPWQNPTVDPAVYNASAITFSPKPSLGKARAMLSPAGLQRLDRQIINHPEKDYLQSRSFLFCNCNLIDLIPKVDGFYALELKETAQILSRLYENSDLHYAALMRFLSVTHYTSSTRPLAWLPPTNALPWVTIGQRPIITNSFPALFEPDYDSAQIVYLEKSVLGLPTQNVPSATVSRIQVSTHRVSFQTQSKEPTISVHNQAWSPHWKATINGAPAPILRVNHAFQGLIIPAGEGKIELIYRDDYFTIGSVISLLCVAWLGFLFYKERK
ncbi:MAG: YfhO family protein [Verrucomicrobiales bacterium]